MSPRRKARAAFVSAVALLCLSALAGYVTITRLLESEKWVFHTYEARAALGDLDSTVVWAGRARSNYLISEANEYLSQFEAASRNIPGQLLHLRELTQDNPRQQELCGRLEELTARRIALLQESVQLKQKSPQDEQRQAELQNQSLPLTSEISSIVQRMREEEQRLLEIREQTSHRLLVLAATSLLVTFLLALGLLVLHYRLLSAELETREKAERIARDGEDSLRRLTGRLLQLQDAERRKFSRELHDSLGQYLAGVKMNLEMFSAHRQEGLFAEAIHLLDQAIAETRTISHLLHPPLLDEAGFSSAAKWYLEGFGQRSGIEVKIELPDNVDQLPKPVALGLFRVLQESLTNIHRHSGSSKADIALTILPARVSLTVRDYGKGIPADFLENFSHGRNSGVGLAGMQERARELGGQLNIRPCEPGTLISITLPLSNEIQAPNASAAD